MFNHWFSLQKCGEVAREVVECSLRVEVVDLLSFFGSTDDLVDDVVQTRPCFVCRDRDGLGLHDVSLNVRTFDLKCPRDFVRKLLYAQVDSLKCPNVHVFLREYRYTYTVMRFYVRTHHR